MFTSIDFYSSAYLMAEGVPLVDTNRQGSHTVFIFEDSTRVKELLDDYFAMQATVNASAYAQSIKNLKSIIHGHRITTQSDSNYANFRKETE